MNRSILALISCLTVFAIGVGAPGVLFADEAALLNAIKSMENNMKILQQTVERQNQRIAELERGGGKAIENAGAGTSAPMSDYEFGQRLDSATGGAQKWLKDLSFKGDLRLRYEAFHNASGNPSETDDRNRFRYRLRYGFEKKFNDDMNIGFSMASGEASSGQNVDPTSTNTSFDNNFNFKDIFIEKAYATYSPSLLKDRGPLKKFTVVAGKQDNKFERGSSDIVWDRDVKPEGAIETADFRFIDTEDFQLNSYFHAGQFVLDEDATLGGDANLFAYQAGINPVVYTPFFERPVDWLSAFSFYDYSNYAANNNFLIGTTSLARGNPNSLGATTELDAGDFNVFEAYHEVSLYPFGFPVRPFFDWAHNFANQADHDGMAFIGTDEDDTWALGVKLGGIVKKGDWEIGYAFKNIDANAVPGFNDSDFGYSGHSAKRGNVLKGGYAITDNLTVNLAAFFVNNLNSGTGTVLDEEQRRFQTDLVWKF